MLHRLIHKINIIDYIIIGRVISLISFAKLLVYWCNQKISKITGQCRKTRKGMDSTPFFGILSQEGTLY